MSLIDTMDQQTLSVTFLTDVKVMKVFPVSITLSQISPIMSVKYTRGNYSEETLKKAVEAVKEDGLSFGVAANFYGVPKATVVKYSKATVVGFRPLMFPQS